MSDGDAPCSDCGDSETVMLFVKRFFIMMLFLGVYCVFLCCFASGIMSPRDPPGNVELAVKDDEIRMQVVAFMFPGSKHNGSSINASKPDPESQNDDDLNDSNENESCCAICLDRFAPTDLIVSSSCEHEFHRDCLWGWAKKNNGCPYCRQELWEEGKYEAMKKEILERRAQKDTDANMQVQSDLQLQGTSIQSSSRV